MRMEPTAVYLPVEEGYVAWVGESPGAATQGATLDEAREMLADAVRRIIEAARDSARDTAGAAEVVREPFVITG